MLEYPNFPESWSQVVGGKIFQSMINWHMMSTKECSTQDEFNKAFALKAEIYHPKSFGSKYQKSQHSHQQDGNEDVEMTEEVDNNDVTNEGDLKPSPHK
jgi:hypothetical protein